MQRKPRTVKQIKAAQRERLDRRMNAMEAVEQIHVQCGLNRLVIEDTWIGSDLHHVCLIFIPDAEISDSIMLMLTAWCKKTDSKLSLSADYVTGKSRLMVWPGDNVGA